MKNQIKRTKGITLIALVITIIVLLILAGVTIASLTGDNGLLQKATSAKQENEEASALEKVKVEVAGSYGLDGKIDIDELNKNLKRITGLKYNDDSLSNSNRITEFPIDLELNGFRFTIADNGKVLSLKKVDIINKKIGNVVNGYNAQGLNWCVFYADANETFLITQSTATDFSFRIPEKRKKFSEDEQEYTYKGSEDVRNSAYGAKWNKKWLEKCNGQEQTITKAKATAYMCDPYNWKEYKTGPANYAVGGPTVELFIKSYNKLKGTDLSIENNDVTTIGYVNNKPSELFPANALNGFYNIGRNYFIASPSAHADPFIVRGVTYQGSLNQFYSGDAKIYVRPIVSIPTSNVSMDGETVTINP